MIRFFCERCGEEMWELVEWEDISYLTLDEVKQRLVCSDCLLAEARAEAEAAETTMLRQCMRACVDEMEELREAVETAKAWAIRLQEFLEEREKFLALAVNEICRQKVRAEAAEAEAARLREALEKIVNLNPSNWCASWTGGVDACDTMKLIAQAALSKEAE